ncbi:MAG: carboxypeptidase regulatory-like domain-containing protein [Pyrinomonadaceae bacterium]
MTSIIGKLGLRTSLLILSVGLFVGVQAQSSTTGNINGSVRDQKGAAVAGAAVMIDEVTTGFSRTVESDSNGNFSAPSMPFGKYSISTSPAGFKKTVNSDLELHVNQNLVINLVVEVGEVSETVTVSGETQQVETRSGDVSSLVSEKQVTELPLNGRNYAALVTMIPGVSPVTQSGAGGAFGTRGTGLDSHVDMSVNGNGSNQNLWTVDGVNNMDVGSNATLLVFPSIDSIQEFRVERNSFSAEYGQAQGAVINLITKGGGNQFHGSLYEFYRSDKLNANNPFIKATPPTPGFPDLPPARPKLKYNNFGGNFSGPIVKNRAFFFWSEEWRREKRGTPLSVQNVPTAAQKLGDFSGPITGAVPRDPATGLPFPGNRIPAARLSPAGLAILKIYPDPNLGLGQWIGAPVEPVKTRQDSIRGDVSITSKMNLMVRWINEKWSHGEASGNFWGDSPFPTLSSDWDQPSRSFAVRLTNTINSTSVNDFQFSRAGNDIFITTSAATKGLDDEIGSKFPTVFPRAAGFNTPTFWGADGYPALWHEAPWTNHEDLLFGRTTSRKLSGIATGSLAHSSATTSRMNRAMDPMGYISSAAPTPAPVTQSPTCWSRTCRWAVTLSSITRKWPWAVGMIWSFTAITLGKCART